MKALIAFLISLPLWAQVDFPNPIRSGGTLPATCRPGSLVPALFVLTSGTPVTSAQAYQCTAADTWTAIPTSGGGGGSPVAPTDSIQRNAGGGLFGSTGINWTGDYVGSTISYSTGLNDAVYGGTYSDTVHPGAVFYAYITTTGTPDKFSWAKCIGPANCTMEIEVSITGMAQDLSDGVTITFGATTGHLLNDEWDVVTGFTRLGNLKLSDNPGSAAGVAYFSLTGELTADPSLSYLPGGYGLRVNSRAVSAATPTVYGAQIQTQFVPANGTDSLAYYLLGVIAPLTATTTGVVPTAANFTAGFTATGAQVVDVWPVLIPSPQLNSGATIQNYYGLRIDALSPFYTVGTIANPYYSWFDSQGVLRVKEDSSFNSVGQAIQALYNPQFAKYTAGAVNYERLILGEWNSNVSEIGNYAGGTGTVRALKLLGSQFSFGTASNISTTTFTGAGLDDGLLGGTYTGATLTYCAKIDATGTPDTFKWGTNGACDNGATGVAITGANQSLSSGVAIKFTATTGHTLADKWSAVATAAATNMSFDQTTLTTPTVNIQNSSFAFNGKTCTIVAGAIACS